MSKASWKKWPEVQYRITDEHQWPVETTFHAQIRTYTEDGSRLEAHHAMIEVTADDILEFVRDKLKDKLRLVVESHYGTIDEECTPKK